MGAKRRIVIIANPVSARGGYAKRKPQMLSSLDIALSHAKNQGIDADYDIVETTTRGTSASTGSFSEGSGSHLARMAVSDGADIVVAAGGDGTIGEVANGIVGTDAVLGIMPMGTGNDLSRSFGIGTDMRLAARTIFMGAPKRIDLGKGAYGYFINIAGCGFDAEVARRVNHGFRKLRGTPAYLAAVVQTLASYKPAEIKLTIDGIETTEVVMLCAIANATSYGGGMRVAPNANVADGLFDVVLIGDVTPPEFLVAFPRVFRGTHLSHPKVKVYRGAQVSIRSSRDLPVLADGEELGVTPATFTIAPRSITVMTPTENCRT